MKHLRKIFEAVSDSEIDREEILETFLLISKMLGDPKVVTLPYGRELKSFTFTWELGLDISKMQDAVEVIDKLKIIIKEIDDVLTASYRFPEYIFNMRIDSQLTIEVVPSDTGENKYNFILGQFGRGIRINGNEVIRFFTSKGCRVTESRISDSDYDHKITYSIGGEKRGSAIDEFCDLFNSEYKTLRKNGDMNRHVFVVPSNTSSGFIIYTEDEKTYFDIR